MPQITIEELRVKYPKIYPIIKAAEDFDKARDILRDLMVQIISKSENGNGLLQEETMELVCIIHGTIETSLKIVDHAKKSYENIHKTLTKYTIPEQ